MPRSVLLIAGIDALGVSRLPRLFSDAGYCVHLLGSDRLAAAKSRFVTTHIRSAPGTEAAVRTAVDHLAVARARYDRVILADEPTLWAALDLGSPEWMRGWFPVPLTAEYTGRLRSKNTLLCDSRDAGIATPHFQVCLNEEQLRCAVRCIGFPVFIKATRGLAGSGLLFVRNMADLESQRGRISFENPLLVQAEIDGEPGSVSVLYENGIPVCWFSYLMTRTWPNRFSSASTIRMFPHPEAASLTASIGRLTQFNGLAGIDFILDARNNRLILLEFNPRPTPVYHLGPRAGVDFGQALRDIDSRHPSVQSPGDSRQHIELFPQALYDATEHLQPLRFFSALRDAPWSEKGLTAGHFRRFLTHYLPDSIKDGLKNRR